jgi:molecular chaperone GrpE (heat shock protein)
MTQENTSREKITDLKAEFQKFEERVKNLQATTSTFNAETSSQKLKCAKVLAEFFNKKINEIRDNFKTLSPEDPDNRISSFEASLLIASTNCTIVQSDVNIHLLNQIKAEKIKTEKRTL